MTQSHFEQTETNISAFERWGSVLGGSGLLLYALKNRTLRLPALLLGGGLFWRGVSGQSFAYKALGVNTAVPEKTEINVEKAVTINRSPQETYQFWRQLENLPRFMSHLESVQVDQDGQSHWKAKIPGNLPVEWDARIVDDRPHELIAWETEPDSRVQHYGMVQFKPAPGGRGTELKVNFRYSPPGGIVGEAIGKLLSAVTAQQIKEDIRRCKSVLETGEIPTIKGQPVAL